MACFQCELLFEVVRIAPTSCPRCAQPLEAHDPEEIYDLDETGQHTAPVQPTSGRASGEERTVLIGGLSGEHRRLLQSTKEVDLNEEDTDAFAAQPTEAFAQDPLESAATGDFAKPVPTDEFDAAPTRALSRDGLVDLAPPAAPPAGGRSGPVPPPRKKPPRKKPPKRSAPPKPAAPAPPESSSGYFDGRSRMVDVPDALGDMISKPAAPTAPKSVPPSTRKSGNRGGKGPLWALLVLVPLVGLPTWLLTRTASKPPSAAGSTDGGAAAPKAGEGSALKKAVAQALSGLPEGPHVDAVPEDAWIVAGPETLLSSVGPVIGLASARVPGSQLRQGPGGAYSPAVVRTLRRAKSPGRDRIAVGVQPSAQVRTLLLFAHSAKRAGFPTFSLLIQRQDREGKLGAIDLGLVNAKAERPSAGTAVIRVGRLGVRVDIEGRGGERISKPSPAVPRDPGGGFDPSALERRLEALDAAYPLIRLALLYPDPEMKIRHLVPLLTHLREAPQRDRYPTIRVVAK